MSAPKKVVLAYSGGLDTSIILKWLQTEYGCEVVTFTADLGQGDVDAGEVVTAGLHLGADLVGFAGFGGEDLTCVDPLSGEEWACSGEDGMPGVGDAVLAVGCGGMADARVAFNRRFVMRDGWVCTQPRDPAEILRWE